MVRRILSGVRLGRGFSITWLISAHSANGWCLVLRSLRGGSGGVMKFNPSSGVKNAPCLLIDRDVTCESYRVNPISSQQDR